LYGEFVFAWVAIPDEFTGTGVEVLLGVLDALGKCGWSLAVV